MSDDSKRFETTSAPSTSKRTPIRPLGQFPVLNPESDGSNKQKSTAKHIEERDRPRNLVPTSHKPRTANFTPNPEDPRDVLRRSTERNTVPPPFTLRVPYTSRRIVDGAAAVNDPQTFQSRPCIECRQHQDSKSTIEYWPTLLGDRQESLEPLADDATTFLHLSQRGLSVVAPVYRGRVAPSQSPATSETSNSPSSTKGRRYNELCDRILAARPSCASPISVKHEVDSRPNTPRNDASGMERAAVILRASNHHGATPPAPWNYSQDPLPFRAHTPVHPILIPDYDALEERYFRNLRQEEPLPIAKRVEPVETSLISNESGADVSHTPPPSRSLRWLGAERARLPTLQRGSEVATLERNSSEHGPIHRTFQTSDTRAIDSPVPNLLKSSGSEYAPSGTALTTPNGSRRRKQISLPRHDTAVPENLASIPPETNVVTRQKTPSLRAGSAERASMSTDPSPSVPLTKKPAPSASSSSSAEDRQPKKQSRTSTTSSSHMDFYGSSTFDWDAPYLPSSIPTSLLLNNQYQHSVTVSPHQLHTPHTHHHYHHHQHVSPFSLHHQPSSSILYPISPAPPPPIYPTSIPPHLTTLNHAQSTLPTHTPLIPFHPEPPPAYVPLAPAPTRTQHGGKEKPQFAPLFHNIIGNSHLVNHGDGVGASNEGGDRKGKGKSVDRSASTASTGTTGKKRKRDSSVVEDEGVDVRQRRVGKKIINGVDGAEDEGHGTEEKDPSSPQDKKKTGRKRNNKIDIACNNCRSRKLKCDGARPNCANCTRATKECLFDLVPRRRGPAKHKQLKLDAETESSWPDLRPIPRTRARAAAEAKILTQPHFVGVGRSAGTGVSEASLAGGSVSVAHPSAMSILFGEEFAILALPDGESMRENTPAADEEKRNEQQIEEPQASNEKEEEAEERQEEAVENPSVVDREEREVRPNEEVVKPTKETSPKKEKKEKKEQKTEARAEMDGSAGKVDILKAESLPSHYLPGRHSTSYPSTSTLGGYIGGLMAGTMSTGRSPLAVAATGVAGAAAGPPDVGTARGHEEEQGGVSDEEAESGDDDYDSQGEESE